MGPVKLEAGNRLYVRLFHKGNTCMKQVSDKLDTIVPAEIPINLSPGVRFNDAQTLADVVGVFSEKDVKKIDAFFSERCQAQIGNFLYNSIFQEVIDRQRGKNIATEVCIITSDEFLMHLPWYLLADDGLFLATAIDWKIFQSRAQPGGQVDFPAFPRIAVITPEPGDLEQTGGSEHLGEIEAVLESVATDLVSVENFFVIRSISELAYLQEFKPDMLYFYGHGSLQAGVSRLAFQNPENRTAEHLGVVDFAKMIHAWPDKPQIVYINCCFGDTAGWLGIGNQLSETIPVVVTNRTVAYVNSSREIALRLIKDVVGGSVDPVSAMNSALQLVSRASSRAIAPVFYANYGEWNGSMTAAREVPRKKPDWLIYMDRKQQTSRLVYETDEMMRNNLRHSLGFFWYGQDGQGVDVFHRRLQAELRTKLTNVQIRYETIPLPHIAEDFRKSIEELYCRQFGLEELSQLSGEIGRLLPYSTRKKRLLIVDHLPIEIVGHPVISSEVLEAYLDWWSSQFLRNLPGDIHALFGMSFVLPGDLAADKFDAIEADLLDILHQAIAHNFLTLSLPPLKPVTVDDLIRFIQESDLVQRERIREVARNIYKETGGHYQQTCQVLESLEKTYYKFLDKDAVEKKRSF